MEDESEDEDRKNSKELEPNEDAIREEGNEQDESSRVKQDEAEEQQKILLQQTDELLAETEIKEADEYFQEKEELWNEQQKDLRILDWEAECQASWEIYGHCADDWREECSPWQFRDTEDRLRLERRLGDY
jgi:hypothetical protein